MNLIDRIALLVFGVSFLVVFIFLWRKGRQLRLLDIDAMPSAKLRSKKFEIIEKRILRKADAAKSNLRERVAPFGSEWSKRFHALYRKIESLEWKYRNALHVTPRTKEEKEQRRAKIAVLMDQGAQLLKDENYGEAEKTFLEVIRLSPKNADAYESLGEVYYYKADYDHAIETLQFVRKLDSESDRVECDLGMIYQKKGEMEKALRHFQEAMRLAPNNPRNLDYTLQMALELKRKVLAEKIFVRLQEVNPENQKLPDLKEQIEQL